MTCTGGIVFTRAKQRPHPLGKRVIFYPLIHGDVLFNVCKTLGFPIDVSIGSFFFIGPFFLSRFFRSERNINREIVYDFNEKYFFLQSKALDVLRVCRRFGPEKIYTVRHLTRLKPF